MISSTAGDFMRSSLTSGVLMKREPSSDRRPIADLTISRQTCTAAPKSIVLVTSIICFFQRSKLLPNATSSSLLRWKYNSCVCSTSFRSGYLTSFLNMALLHAAVVAADRVLVVRNLNGGLVITQKCWGERHLEQLVRVPTHRIRELSCVETDLVVEIRQRRAVVLVDLRIDFVDSLVDLLHFADEEAPRHRIEEQYLRAENDEILVAAHLLHAVRSKLRTHLLFLMGAERLDDLLLVALGQLLRELECRCDSSCAPRADRGRTHDADYRSREDRSPGDKVLVVLLREFLRSRRLVPVLLRSIEAHSVRSAAGQHCGRHGSSNPESRENTGGIINRKLPRCIEKR